MKKIGMGLILFILMMGISTNSLAYVNPNVIDWEKYGPCGPLEFAWDALMQWLSSIDFNALISF